MVEYATFGGISIPNDLEGAENVSVERNLHVYDNLSLDGEIYGSLASQTITRNTNINDYETLQIGCFCETAGQIADVYSHEIGLEHATDVICKVKVSDHISSRVIGKIMASNCFASHGDVCDRAVYNSEYALEDMSR
jgi:hypothetical protein